MEFKYFLIIGAIFSIVNSENIVLPQLNVPMGLQLVQEQKNESKKVDTVQINGTIVDSITGLFPLNDSIVVTIDSNKAVIDSEGSFGIKIPKADFHRISISSIHFTQVSQVIRENPDKKNYFISYRLQRTNDTLRNTLITKTEERKKVGPCWTISGCVVDSKHDLAIKSDETHIYFDERLIENTPRGSFEVNTCKAGIHVFRLKIPGYHEVIEQVDLKNEDKQPFITIPTTKLQNKISRREITVTAKREPVHVIAEVSKTEITRTELTRTAANLNDPLRVVQTLPGVASQSDASARPVVRGGEPRETRVFIDAIPLMQPFHFGGGRSMFNELSMKNITLYKSGFPANYSNAQSALLVINRRKPAEEPFTFESNLNLMQFDAYLGKPLFNRKAGVYLSFQTSYQDFFYQRYLDLLNPASSENSKSTVNQIKQDVHLPDYLDFSTGFELKPNDKFQLSINEMYNTDGYKVIQRSQYGTEGIHAQLDTFIDYSSNYNVLDGEIKYLPASDQAVTVSGAWQKRWWNLKFPAPFSVFYDTSLYNVDISQFNFNANWLYAGFSNHILNTGFQVDYNRANYDVNVARVIHQVILNGNTNFADFWGPLTNDNGMTLLSNQFSAFNTEEMIKHIFVKYNGNSKWYNGGFFLRDEWNVSPRFSLDLGSRFESSRIDHSLTFSPRISAKYSLTPGQELILSAGHYTQNNYDISSIALSNNLKPEKVWHASIGDESRLLPWLSQKVDFYGKYYYDLITEVIQGTSSVSADSVYRATFGSFYVDSLTTRSKQMLSDIITEYNYSNNLLESHYGNNGRGYSYGVEYFLRYDPFDFWNGWISLTASHSMRQDNVGWRWHSFPLDRPFMVSLVNYYRLPRNYEISLKYHYMSGLPYTSAIQDSSGTHIGSANDSRYIGYQRLDLKFSKGFTIKDSKAHFYIEAWNVLNSPNTFLIDKNSKRLIGFDMNIPVPTVFIGLDFNW